MVSRRVPNEASPMILSILLLATAVASGPPGGSATESHTMLQVPAPTWESTIDMPVYESNYSFTFHRPTTRLVGHHEWRSVAPMTVNVSYEHAHDHGHEHGHDAFHEYEEALDLRTGLLLGSMGADESEGSFLSPAGIALVGEELELSWYAGYGIGPHGLLPESLLWNRPVGFGDAWDVQMAPTPSWGEQASARVTTSRDWATGDLRANVTTTVVYPAGGDSVRYVAAWSLVFDASAGPSPVASSRAWNAAAAWVDAPLVWGVAESFPATYNGVTGPTVDFEGASDETLVGPRDQRLPYGAPGLAPFDPEPHHRFDVGEAAAAALALDDEDMEAFLSRAEDPYVTFAAVTLDAVDDGQVHWSLRLEEAGHNAVDVFLDGIKVDGLPLVVVQAQADAGHADDPVSAGARATLELAGVGAWARLVDDVAEDAGLRVYSYSWSLWGYGDAFLQNYVGFSATDSTGVAFGGDTLRADADGRTGILFSTFLVETGLALLPGGLPIGG